MKLERNLKTYLYYHFPYYKFSRKDHLENNNKYTRKMFLIKVSETLGFKVYSFQCEMKSLLTVVQQRLSKIASLLRIIANVVRNLF